MNYDGLMFRGIPASSVRKVRIVVCPNIDQAKDWYQQFLGVPAEETQWQGHRAFQYLFDGRLRVILTQPPCTTPEKKPFFIGVKEPTVEALRTRSLGLFFDRLWHDGFVTHIAFTDPFGETVGFNGTFMPSEKPKPSLKLILSMNLN